MSNSECLNGTEEKGKTEENQLQQTEDDTKEGDKIDDSDEDVPGDFFDDFLKEDFMAGLDIVDDDEWDDAKIKIDREEVAKKSNDNVDTSLSKETMEILKKRKKQMVSSKDGRTDEKSERRNKQKKKKYEEKKDIDKRKRTSDKQIDADEFDIRRDPEKTKRDIARDKVRCEKDKEMKIISEKLSMVETGLVPPGMEMELDIEEVKRQKEKLEVKSPRDLREHLRDLKERNKSPERSSRELKIRNRSNEHVRDFKEKRSSEHHDAKEKNRSPEHLRDAKERNRSPLQRQRSPLRKRSIPRRSPLVKRPSPPLRKRSRSPRARDTTNIRSAISPKRSPLRRASPRHRSSERVFSRRRSRSSSPYYRSRRTRFRRSSSRESDREKWLKSRNRSRSPRRKREEKKKSFLQEIAEKLNEIRQPIMAPPLQPVPQMQPMLQPMPPTLHYIQTQPVPVPAPAPVPPPETVFLAPQQLYDPYDQNFFIGTPTAPNNFPCPSQPSPIPGRLQMPLNPVSIPNPENKSILASSVSASNINNVTPKKLNFTNRKQRLQKPESQEDVEKLFQDKQITLSEFLAITAKPEVSSSSPKHLQEKIKVITRCHEAIKFLSDCEQKYSGKLVVNKPDKYKVSTTSNISPLLRAPSVSFPFTNPIEAVYEKKNGFNIFVNNLLQKLGLLQDVVNIDDDEVPNITTGVKNPIKFSPPPPPMITPIQNPFPAELKQVQSTVKKQQMSKMMQTDIFKCEDCEKRKKILCRTTAMQVDDPPATFSVSTQVTEEELQPRIPKTQSLAALTPAQLLAKSRESLSAATRANRMDVNAYDLYAAGQNRSNFFRPLDGFGLPRPVIPPYSSSSLMYDTLNHQMLGGGGRGREPMGPRSLDPRYTYNNFY